MSAPIPHAPKRSLRELIDEAAHLLPSQPPLHAFVHHNTLHAFEHMPFEEAVVHASELLGTEPFQSEAAFAKCVASGRIRHSDIDAVVDEHDDRRMFPKAPSPREFRRQRLRYLFDIPAARAVPWLLDESALLRELHPLVPAKRRTALSPTGGTHGPMLQTLWQTLASVAPAAQTASCRAVRRRDQLLAATGIDVDDLVHPLLIRVSAAFVDQGVAYWEMPGRKRGLLTAFRELYGLGAPPPDRLLRGLSETLQQHAHRGWTSERTIIWALKRLRHGKKTWPLVIRATLLSLRGWAGMVRQLEERPDRAPVAAPPSSLMDYLAMQLVLDCVAANNLLERERPGVDFVALQRELRAAERAKKPERDLTLVYEAFVLAQILPVDIHELDKPSNARRWLAEVRRFNPLERRRLLHLAYERRHRVEVLDGLSAHLHISHKAPPPPQFQAAFCIDDREESLRRHLEECFPAVSTYGYAGFFGVAMQYQGLDDVRPRPLCPVPVTPKHLIREDVEHPSAKERYLKQRKAQGTFSHSLTVGSKTLLRGSILSTIFGIIALVPLVARSVFPRLAARWSHVLGHRAARRPHTELQIENVDGTMQGGLQVGYTVLEMTNIVTNALATMGLTQNFCPIVLMVGHGSSSLNNPHEAAHDCGATGGGRGGPNARAFAAMANHAEVRQQLVERGISIPASTWFVGAYHNTCDDTMTYYDEENVPAELESAFRDVQRALAEACDLDAHERCRRFETSPALMSVEQAVHQARIHAEDLAEPRPEYGHATNAVCIVGRRERTRGLFLDRRAFLVSYDPVEDDDGEILRSLLLAVGPVGAGINLEYYFSFVDPHRYGCGTKLPHNITGLIGVMDGHASDLRTGLPWQMVEIHEPVRLLNIVEAKLELLETILEREPGLAELIGNAWIQLVALDPNSHRMHVFRDGAFERYVPESSQLPELEGSRDMYDGHTEHLGPAHIHAAFGS